MAREKTESRIAFISFLQFIGVISVIFGHSMNGISAPGLLTDIKAWIYTWHMPLFFFVSAFLFAYKGGYDQGYKNVLSKRFWRLLVPYVIWNAAFIIPKYLLMPLLGDVTKDTAVEFSVQYFIRIILRPRDNILGHTWFLFALFEMFLIAILFDKARRKKELWIPITLVLIIINCFGVENRWLAVGDLMKNGVFFWCGLLLGSFKPDDVATWLKDKWLVGSAILIVIGSTIVWIFNSDLNINTVVLGITVLFLFMIIQLLSGIRGGLIEFVSRNSFPIYIMHWPIIMVLRLFFYQKIGLPPVPSMIINLVLGFGIAYGITYLLRKIKTPWIQKICTVVFGM